MTNEYNHPDRPRTTVRIKKTTLDGLQILAKQEGISRNAMMERALEKFLKARRSRLNSVFE